MADINIVNGNLVVSMQGLRRLWTLKKQLVFPLKSVGSVSRDTDVRKEFPKFWEKRMGTNVFRTYYGGTFSRRGEKVFWDVRDPDATLVITLVNEKYPRLILDVADPGSTLHEIEGAMNTPT